MANSEKNRISMQKLLLINWARFQYQLVNINGSAFFFGPNGSGKSTILDALTYVLTGNIEFNIAAKDKDRTVKSYVRGDTKTNENQFLRGEGPVVSYIATEFYNPVERKTFVIGVVMESQDNSTPVVSNWFILKETRIDEIDFCEQDGGEAIVNPRRSLTVHHKRIPSNVFISKKQEAIAQVLRTLGIRTKTNNIDVYRKKLLAMMTFDPQKNIDKFISDCVLQESPVKSLDQLKNQKALFEDAKMMYQAELDGRNVLKRIDIIASEYDAKKESYLINDMILDLQRAKSCENDIDRIQHDLIMLNSKLEACKTNYIKAKEELNRAISRLSTADNMSVFSDFKDIIDNLKNQKDKATKELEFYSNEIKKLKITEDIIKKDLGWFIQEDEELLFNEDVLNKLSVDTDSLEIKHEVFSAFSMKCKEAENKMRGDYAKYDNENESIKIRLNDVVRTIASLNDNILQFPAEIKNAKMVLQHELEKLGIKTEVRIFAELVRSIRNEEWRAAIETYLGYRRYDFIIDEQYCSIAAQIIRDKSIYGVHVVYTDKLPNTEAKDGSAAKQLDIPNILARRYANYLLNNIHLCESMDELHEYSLGGITKDGMVAKGYTVSKRNLKKTEMCLGQGALEYQKNKAEKEKKSLIHKKNETEGICEDLKKKIECLNRFDREVGHYSFNAPYDFKKLQERIKEIDKDINAYKNNPDFMSMLAEKEKADLELKKAQNELEKINKNIGSLETQIKKKEEEDICVKREYDSAYASYEKKKGEHLEIVYLAEEKYKKLAKEKNKCIVVTEKTVKNQFGELHEIEKKLETEQLEYCAIRSIGNSRRGAVFIPWYRNEYAEVSNIKLEDAKNKMEERERDLQSSFMHDFIGEIYDAMRVAKNEVNTINKELKKLPFGEDVYQFVMEERPERRIFFNIAKKITECNSLEMYSAINGYDEELENDIQTFMDVILEEEDETEYTDYRKYYTFDMSMTRRIGQGTVTANLSKKQGSASNGEKQTPYFIILAASLMQFYPKNTCCARIAPCARIDVSEA